MHTGNGVSCSGARRRRAERWVERRGGGAGSGAEPEGEAQRRRVAAEGEEHIRGLAQSSEEAATERVGVASGRSRQQRAPREVRERNSQRRGGAASGEPEAAKAGA